MPRRPLLSALAAACAVAALAPAVAAAKPGQLDPTFGVHGRLTVDNVFSGLGEDGTGLGDIEALRDGRIVVVGSQRFCMGCFSQVVARYAADGTPDASFGGTGVREFLGTDDYGDGSSSTGLVVRRDGGLVIGYAGGTGPRMLQVAPDGDEAPELATEQAFRPSAQLPDGRILAQDVRGERMFLLRPDITVDPSFGGPTGVPIPFGPRSLLDVGATAGSVLVAGTSGASVILVRYRLDGSRAATMRARVPKPARTDRWYGSAAQRHPIQVANGRAVITTTWTRTSGRRTDWRSAVAAFSLRSNRVVTGFGKNGVAFAAQRYAHGLLQRDGRVVLVASGDQQFPMRAGKLIIRRLGATGRPDRAFGVRTVATGVTQLIGMDAALDPAGRLLVGGGAFIEYPGQGVRFLRFLTR
jgi:uncharacterized delta-60 repeat protein